MVSAWKSAVEARNSSSVPVTHLAERPSGLTTLQHAQRSSSTSFNSQVLLVDLVPCTPPLSAVSAKATRPCIDSARHSDASATIKLGSQRHLGAENIVHCDSVG